MVALKQRVIHGEWDIQCIPEASLILIKGKGGWNLEAAECYARHFVEKAKLLKSSRWLCIGYAVDWELGVPQIEPVIHELYDWMEQNGCVAQCSIVKSAIAKAQLSKMMEVGSKNFNVHLVSSMQDLASVVAEKGFVLPVQQLTDFVSRPYPILR